MAGGGNTVVARVGLDDSGFQEGVNKIQRSLKVVQSEFAAASAKLGDFGKSTEGLKLKADSLNSQMELQKDKVAALNRAYQESADKKGLDAKATENLKIKLNYATAELAKLEQELKATTAELKTKTSAWNKLSESMDKTGERMKAVGDKMSSVGQSLSAAVTLPLLGIGTAATKMAMDAVESENLFEVSMGSMVAKARQWSDETSKALGLNAYAVRNSMATYNAMLTSMGLTADESLKMSEGLTQLSYDMASFYNLKPEEAFEKLKSGISGEAEPLKALGILVNDTTIKTYAYANGIAKEGEALTEAQKVQARYGAIMQATSKAQGDLGRTMDSPTNKLRIMKEQAAQIGIQFGQILIPVLEQLIAIIKPLMDSFQGLSKDQQEQIVKIALIVAAIGPVILIIGQVISIFGALSTAIGAVTGAIAAAGGAAAAFGAVFAVIIGPIGIAIAVVAALIAIGVLLYKNWDTIVEGLQLLWQALSEAISKAASAIKNTVASAWNAVKAITTAVFLAVGTAVYSAWQAIVATTTQVLNSITSAITTAWNTVRTVTTNALNALTAFLTGAWNGMKNTVVSVWTAIAGFFTGLWQSITETFNSAINALQNAASSAWNSILATTTNVWNNIKNAIMSPITAAVNFVRDQIERLKSFFSSISFQLPPIKLPHFSISGSFSLNPPKVPHISVDWYASGGIFNRPSIIGVGEAGSEAVLPIDRLDELMARAIAKARENTGGGITLTIENFINNSSKDIEQLAYELEFYRQRAAMGRGGA